MPTSISKALGVTHEALIGTAAFDGFADVDSRLYVDPHLLAACPVPELAPSRARFEKHFRDVISLLLGSKRRGDLLWREARSRLVFREIPSVPLGYSKGHTSGNAIGGQLATRLTDLASEIVAAGITDPRLFELVGLLQEGIGADRVSDMTIRIILPDLLRFSARAAEQLGADSRRITFGGSEYAIPTSLLTGKTVVLVPQSILRNLPVANSWHDIDLVAHHNSALRARVNPIIGETWRRATSRRVSKAELRSTVVRYPELMRDLLAQYAAKPAIPYDFEADPAAQQAWYYFSRQVADQDPLDLSAFQHDAAGLIGLVRAICARFKKLVEDNRLSRLLYNDDGTPRHERAAQLAFFGIADAYCEANGLDLSPEADAGGGPVDFKLSKGYEGRVLVELKLSSNRRLVRGFTHQLPAYARAEQSIHDILLVVRTTERDDMIKKVQQLARQAVEGGRKAPEIILVDGRVEPSASKR